MKKVYIAVGIIVPFLFVGLMYAGYHNKEVALRKAIEAKQKANEAVYDEVWKVIKQNAQVTDKYEKGFEKIYSSLMEGRYGNARGGSLLSFINEANPQFDSAVYTRLQNAIEGQRAKFTENQKLLVDLKREHETLLVSFPAKIFVGSRDSVDIVVVTSGKTDKTFATGQENDVNVF